ncbi:hypothetical protein DRQ25_12870 [Candidatus Fermentibacteria bacterium]|nr:MAG: hypothetical protein DRQ25_12870 [Candidatus Fermentibacteria bacterium]
MAYFRLSLKPTQLVILLALVAAKPKLSKGWLKKQPTFTLWELSKVSNLDFRHTISRYKDWLIESRILVPTVDTSNFYVDYDVIAYLLFNKLETRVLHEFALEYLDKPSKPAP